MVLAGGRTERAYRQARRVGGKAYRSIQKLPARAADYGVPAAWMGYRWVAAEPVPEYLARRGGLTSYATIHSEAVADNPLPRNVARRDLLPAERGWWGYSFRDVPSRHDGETFIATVPDCRVISFVDPKTNNFYPCIINGDDRALALRELPFRDGHRRALRDAASPVRLERATWILERVYHNHSHWLTAHLPKLCLLKQRGQLGNLVLPRRRNRVIEESLGMLGLDPEDFATYDADRPLQVEHLTVLGTDRFRPELLRPVRAAMAGEDIGPAPVRRVFISRAKSTGRRLLDEDAIWPLLDEAGFERVFMEDLGFAEQVRLMQETAVLLAPHGAGLTNMMFCRPGTHVIELADLGFPNPNFYALACAMGHHYWLVAAEGVGQVHPLLKDLRVGRGPVRDVIRAVDAAAGR